MPWCITIHGFIQLRKFYARSFFFLLSTLARAHKAHTALEFGTRTSYGIIINNNIAIVINGRNNNNIIKVCASGAGSTAFADRWTSTIFFKHPDCITFTFYAHVTTNSIKSLDFFTHCIYICDLGRDFAEMFCFLHSPTKDNLWLCSNGKWQTPNGNNHLEAARNGKIKRKEIFSIINTITINYQQFSVEFAYGCFALKKLHSSKWSKRIFALNKIQSGHYYMD